MAKMFTNEQVIKKVKTKIQKVLDAPRQAARRNGLLDHPHWLLLPLVVLQYAYKKYATLWTLDTNCTPANHGNNHD